MWEVIERNDGKIERKMELSSRRKLYKSPNLSQYFLFLCACQFGALRAKSLKRGNVTNIPKLNRIHVLF